MICFRLTFVVLPFDGAKVRGATTTIRLLTIFFRLSFVCNYFLSIKLLTINSFLQSTGNIHKQEIEWIFNDISHENRFDRLLNRFSVGSIFELVERVSVFVIFANYFGVFKQGINDSVVGKHHRKRLGRRCNFGVFFGEG